MWNITLIKKGFSARDLTDLIRMTKYIPDQLDYDLRDVQSRPKIEQSQQMTCKGLVFVTTYSPGWKTLFNIKRKHYSLIKTILSRRPIVNRESEVLHEGLHSNVWWYVLGWYYFSFMDSSAGNGRRSAICVHEMLDWNSPPDPNPPPASWRGIP